MTNNTLYLGAFIAACGTLALIWRNVTPVNEALRSFESLEGMHFNEPAKAAPAPAVSR